jgi:hypothetical protein
MTNPYGSFRNKLEDVGRALAKGDSVWACMTTYELGIWLGPAMSTLQSQTGNASREVHPATRDCSSLNLLSQFGAEVSQLRNQLEAMQLELAADVVKRMFELVDGLDQNLLSVGSDPVPKAGEE